MTSSALMSRSHLKKHLEIDVKLAHGHQVSPQHKALAECSRDSVLLSLAPEVPSGLAGVRPMVSLKTHRNAQYKNL